MKISSKHINIIAIIALFLFLTVTEEIFGAYIARILNLGAIYSICALSMNLVNGFTGLFSLGQAGFMAIGAYTSALLVLSPKLKEFNFYLEPIVPWLANIELPFIITLIAGGLMAALFAFIIGFPVLRLRGDYLAIATLGFSEIIRVFITMQQRITNGSLGIKSIPSLPEISFGPFRIGALWWTFGILALVTLAIVSLMNTSYGRAIKSICEDEVAAQAMGINLFKHKMIAFVMSGFFAGVAGALIAALVKTIDPNQFRFILAYNILLMVVLGGLGSISGSIVGAFIVTIAQEALRFVDAPIDFIIFKYPGISGMRMVLFSVLLMVVIIFFSRGIFGRNEFSFDGLARLLKSRKSSVKKGGD